MNVGMQYGGGYAVRIDHTISIEEVHLQCGCQYAALRSHTFNTDADVQYRGGTASVQMQMCNMNQPNHQ